MTLSSAAVIQRHPHPSPLPKGEGVRVAIFLLVALLTFIPARAADTTAGDRLAPRAFRAAVDRIAPSMVTIDTYGAILLGRSAKKGGIQALSAPGEGPTTGLIVSPDGHILTSTYNFIRKPSIITVTLADGSQHVATMLGKDETRKLTLLKIDGVKDLPVPVMAASDEVRVGQWAISVGIGYGDERPAISAGIISGKDRIFGRAVQTDANTSPANYGGPLIDIEGRLIGVCVPLSPGSTAVAAGVEWYDSGIGFAVPLGNSDAWLDQLKQGKTIQPGRIGIVAGPIPPAATLPGVVGVMVTQVKPDSAGAKAGLAQGDRIVAVDGREVVDLLALRMIMGRYVAGDHVKFKIIRADQPLEIVVQLEGGADEMPAPQVIPGTMPIPLPTPAPSPAPPPVPNAPAD
ncbi:MAG: trypsin-like peptidase domain-containing protein [Phycisphaeraceae bacterium]